MHVHFATAQPGRPTGMGVKASHGHQQEPMQQSMQAQYLQPTGVKRVLNEVKEPQVPTGVEEAPTGVKEEPLRRLQ